MNTLDRILEFLEKHLPGLMVAFGLGYRMAKKKDRDAKIKSAQLELENAILKNKEIIRDINSGKSDSNIIDDAISKGRDLP